MRPKRTDDKYWTGTRDFNHIQYESDLEDYIIDLENETQKLRKHAVSGRSEHSNYLFEDVVIEVTQEQDTLLSRGLRKSLEDLDYTHKNIRMERILNTLFEKLDIEKL